MTLSVIVPVYNTRKYLRQCLDSILGQSFADFEVILVDDGSRDGSGKICSEYSLRDPRVKTITQENGGLSRARNTGINAAEGKYIAFVDSDDYLESGCFETAVSETEKFGADCTFFGYERVFEDGTTARFSDFSGTEIFENEEIRDILLWRMVACQYRDISPVSPTAWGKIYKREIILSENLSFRDTKEIFSEDILFNFEYLPHCKKAIGIPALGYVYRDTPLSLSNTYYAKKHLRAGNLYEILSKISDPWGDRWRGATAAYTMGIVSVVVKQLVAGEDKGKIKKIKNIACEERMYKAAKLCDIPRIKFPLSLFCLLMKYRAGALLFILIKIFLLIKR